jgi:hypothetical protein
MSSDRTARRALLAVTPAALLVPMLPRLAAAQTDTGGNAASTTKPDPGMALLSDLICNLNPYVNLPPDQVTGHQTGDMELVMLPGAELTGRDALAAISVQREGGYNSANRTWTFQDRELHIKSAALIPYRFRVMAKNGTFLYYQEESLVVGFAGGDGGA